MFCAHPPLLATLDGPAAAGIGGGELQCRQPLPDEVLRRNVAAHTDSELAHCRFKGCAHVSTLSFQGLRPRGPSPHEHNIVSRAAQRGVWSLPCAWRAGIHGAVAERVSVGPLSQPPFFIVQCVFGLIRLLRYLMWICVASPFLLQCQCLSSIGLVERLSVCTVAFQRQRQTKAPPTSRRDWKVGEYWLML